MQDRFLRRPEVESITGLSRSTIYLMISNGEFPKPARIGRRAVAWRESVIQSWIESRWSMSQRGRGIHVGIPQKLMRSDAFLSLKPNSQIAIVWLDLIYWESTRRNPIEISQRSLSEWIGCSVKTAQTVLADLDDYGFLVRERAGSLKGPVSGRTAIYRLTWQYDNSGMPPTRDYRCFHTK